MKTNKRGVAGKQLKDSFKESDSIKTQRPVNESKKNVRICVVVDRGITSTKLTG
jgi:hypothetical protein